ncbi:MAG TPA: hypothetical protein VNM38_00170 [Solirubrobacterales bacterium]|nr:hypothetical protein [Solirubrobacterales bacterium]
MTVLSPRRAHPDNRPPEQTLSFVNPLTRGRVVVVGAVGEADGSCGAAAALACARADVDTATLLVDAGGRTPRPTLVASAAAQKLEERLAAHLPDHRVAARGQVCHLAVPDEVEGLEAAAAAATVLRDGLTVLHVEPRLLQLALASPNLRPSGVLLRANLREDRGLVGLLVRDLLEGGLDVAVLKRRLNWVAERRALFGVLPPGGSGGLPERVVVRLCGPLR